MNPRLVDGGAVIEEYVEFSLRRRRGRQQISVIHAPGRGGRPLYPVSTELTLPLALGHAWAQLIADVKKLIHH